MKHEISDEQLDLIARRLVQDFSADESVIDEIAESPQLWWGVRRRIAAAETKPAFAWISPWLLRLTAFAAVAVMIGGIAFWSLRSAGTEQTKTEVEVPAPVPVTPEITAVPSPTQPEPDKPVKAAVRTDRRPAVVAKAAKVRTEPRAVRNTEEIKTDFIALSYAPAPESGQVIKVKVPRSMMTSLGVASGSDNGAELVSAEVIVGDDGSAHAIRFIRGSSME